MESDTHQHSSGQPQLFTDEQLLFTAEQAARALHVSRTTVYALLKNGELRAVHIGRSCRFTRAELVRYVQRLDDEASGVDAEIIDIGQGRPRPPGAA